MRETRDDFEPPSRRVAVVLDAELLVLDASIVTPERLVRADRPVIAVPAAARVPANGAAALAREPAAGSRDAYAVIAPAAA